MTSDETVLYEKLKRMSELRFCGVWHSQYGDYALFADAGDTGTSFVLKAGETLGEGVHRVIERYRAVQSRRQATGEVEPCRRRQGRM